jgi:hypothetical protein
VRGRGIALVATSLLGATGPAPGSRTSTTVVAAAPREVARERSPGTAKARLRDGAQARSVRAELGRIGTPITGTGDMGAGDAGAGGTKGTARRRGSHRGLGEDPARDPRPRVSLGEGIRGDPSGQITAIAFSADEDEVLKDRFLVTGARPSLRRPVLAVATGQGRLPGVRQARLSAETNLGVLASLSVLKSLGAQGVRARSNLARSVGGGSSSSRLRDQSGLGCGGRWLLWRKRRGR